jgi:hypothetical protein
MNSRALRCFVRFGTGYSSPTGVSPEEMRDEEKRVEGGKKRVEGEERIVDEMERMREEEYEEMGVTKDEE